MSACVTARGAADASSARGWRRPSSVARFPRTRASGTPWLVVGQRRREAITLMPRAHGEDVAQNSAHAGGGALKRFDEARMIVRLDFESAGPSVADVDDAGILARPLQHPLAARGQALQ